MKFKLICFTIFIFLVGAFSLAKNNNYDGIKILKVYDGDTVLAEINDKKYKSINTFRIRLVGIDCLEGSKSQRAEYQAKKYNLTLDEVVNGGNIAGAILKQELKNKTITFEFRGIDKYSRALGIIYANDENINDKMLNTEYCMPYPD